MTTLWSGSVPVDATDIIDARVERIARRALRHGFPAPTAVYGDRMSIPNDDGITSVEWIGLAIEASGTLRLGDYEFVGTISALGDGSPFITYAPGVERTDYVPDKVNYCDHCRTLRDRNDTYIVRIPGDAALFQVGSSCIKDYTGHSPAAIVNWLNAVNDLSFSDEEIGGWGRSATRFYDPEAIITIASRLVAKGGYVSKQKAEDEDKAATAELVRAWLSARGKELAEFERDYPEDPESVALFMNTMQAIENPTGNSDWMNDIVRLAAAPGVQWRHVGILGSAVILGLRQQERAAVEDRPESTFVGEVGQRLTFTDVTVTLKRGYENAYGFGYVLRMSVDNHDLLWFTSSTTRGIEGLSEGDTINLVATVKGHEIDNRSHRPTTVLTRGSIKE